MPKILFLFASAIHAFTGSMFGARPAKYSQWQRASMMIDPESVDSAASLLNQGTIESVLSTMYTVTADTLLQPAQGHSQPFWGPPDPYLTAGKSIAPTAQGLVNLGIEKTSLAELPDQVKIAASNGWKILDSASIQAEKWMPGFSPTGGILSGHNPRIPDETPETFAAQVEWSARFLNVVDKLPEAAFMYALVEFFLLRPNIDIYKEDIAEEPGAVFLESVATTGVRLAAFALVAFVTTIIF